MAVKFLLKALPNRDESKAPRVLEHVEADSGYKGRVDESIIKANPVAYAKFKAAIKQVGEDKAIEIARETGEFRPKLELRPLAVIRRELSRIEARASELKDELKEVESAEAEKEKARKEAEKEKKKPATKEK